MNKIVGVFFAICLSLSIISCASKPPLSTGMPLEAANARRNAPEDVLVGIGNADLATLAMSRATAAARARAEIANTMNSIVQNMVRDYTAVSEVDPGAAMAFQESITTTLSRSDLSGSVIYWEGPDDYGMWWTVVYLSRENVVREISQAQAAARLAVPRAYSIELEAHMNENIQREIEQGRL